MTTTRSQPRDADVVEVEFEITAPAYPFVSIAAAADCRCSLQQILPRRGGRQAEYFRVADADLDRVVEVASDREGIVSVRALLESEDCGLVEIVVGEGCPARALTVRGAVPTTVEGTPEGGTIVAEILPDDDPSEIVDAMIERQAVELVAKRTRNQPTALLEEAEFRADVLDRLTDRQREVLSTAHEMGYYERPRRNTGEAVAAALEISPTTFQEHLRVAERKLVTFLVEDD